MKSKNDLIGQTHCSWKPKNTKWETFYWSSMLYLPDIQCTLGWTRSFKWDRQQKMTKLFATQNLPLLIHLKKKPNRWAGPYAIIWNHHSPTFLKLRKCHFFRDETQRKNTFTYGSQENQHTAWWWLLWQYSASQHFVRCSLTAILPACLLSGLSLFPDDRPTGSVNACIHFCRHNFCLKETCTKT